VIDALAMSSPRCALCQGYGTINRSGKAVEFQPYTPQEAVCACVWRRIFRVCMSRYSEARVFGGLMRGGPTIPTRASRPIGIPPTPRAFRHAEYVADVELLARRVLQDAVLDWTVFWYYHVLKLPWRECAQLIHSCMGRHLTRDSFFHRVRQTEVRLGREFVSAQPYDVYPQHYFATRQRGLHGANARIN